MRPLKILTWHVHGAYLYYLATSGHDFYLPARPGRPEGYGGKVGRLLECRNLIEVPAESVRDLDVDCVLYQSRRNYLEDQYEVLTEAQRRLPRIYLEHDPPRDHPTDTRHPVDDPDVLLVHVTPFNALMWDSGRTPTRVIDHGVTVPDDICYSGDIERGVVVVNDIAKRGRRLGADVFEEARREIPLDLIGMGSEVMAAPSPGSGLSLGEIKGRDLFETEARYRFFFNPIRYTSLGLSVCEAMALGMPVIGLATTEMATAVANGVTGYVDTDLRMLIERMRELLADRPAAERLGAAARDYARERFGIERFAREWDETFRMVAGRADAYSFAGGQRVGEGV